MRKRESNYRPPQYLIQLKNWAGCILATLGIIALGSGRALHDGALTLNGITLTILLSLATAHYYWRSQIEPPAGPGRLLTELEGPLLLVVLAWTIFRLGGSFSQNLIVIPALTIAWITIRCSATVALLGFLAGVAVEAGLTLTGNQSPFLASANLITCVIVTGVLNFFPGNKSYKIRLRQAKINTARDIAGQEQAAAMGLAAAPLSAPEILQDHHNLGTGNSFSQQTVDNVNKSFQLQLEVIRLALNLTTIAVLWPGRANDDLRLRYLATTRKDIDPGPYPVGTGITGALSANREEMELLGAKPSHPALPYYRKHGGVGAIMALRIPTGLPGSEETETTNRGILCTDRESDNPWSDRERQILRLTAQKLALEISGSRLLLNMDRERTTIHRLYSGLRALNSDPNLESILASSLKAVKTQIRTDFLALSLIVGDQHQVVLADGPGTKELINQAFPVEEGLVGQALKTARTLPAGGRYRGAAPIFANDQTFSDFQSLLVVPLPDEDNKPIGCLVAAAKTPGIFTKNRQEILEIIAAQIAIKIKLGQAHEKLALQATSDGLTGLANHRAFQRGCDVMLDRARRNRTPLCLLMCDLDHFKNLNDNFGHPFGDQVLRHVAGIMAETIRTVDLAARYGGEEFALVLENCDGRSGWNLAERIREKITHLKLTCQDKPITVTLSIGIAVFPQNCPDKTRLIDLADQALYQAKRDGRNRTVLWSRTDPRVT